MIQARRRRRLPRTHWRLNCRRFEGFFAGLKVLLTIHRLPVAVTSDADILRRSGRRDGAQIMIRILVAMALLGVAGNPIHAADAILSYRVVSEDRARDGVTVSVRIAARATETDLIAVAESLRAKKPAKSLVHAVKFYLDTAKLSDPPWADVRFEPAPRVTVRGLRFDEEQAYRAAAASDPRPLLGVWLTSPPAMPGKLSIWREKGGKTFAEWHLRNGQKSIDELVETRSQRGRRFEIAGANGGYYLALWSGGLELGDKTQIIAVAERLTFDAPKSVSAKDAVKAPDVTPAAQPLTQTTAGPLPGTIPNTKSATAKRRSAPAKTAANRGGIPAVLGSF